MLYGFTITPTRYDDPKYTFVVFIFIHWLRFIEWHNEINKNTFQFVQFGLTSSRYLAEVTRLRLHYDEAKRRLSQLKHMLADLEDDMIPGQNESDKDR